MATKHPNIFRHPLLRRSLLAVLAFMPLFLTVDTDGAVLYKNYVVRYDRGWDILCDPYQVQPGDWVLKIFRQKGELAHNDFREFLGIFERLNPHVKDIDRIRPGQVVDIPARTIRPNAVLPGAQPPDVDVAHSGINRHFLEGAGFHIHQSQITRQWGHDLIG